MRAVRRTTKQARERSIDEIRVANTTAARSKFEAWARKRLHEIDRQLIDRGLPNEAWQCFSLEQPHLHPFSTLAAPDWLLEDDVKASFNWSAPNAQRVAEYFDEKRDHPQIWVDVLSLMFQAQALHWALRPAEPEVRFLAGRMYEAFATLQNRHKARRLEQIITNYRRPSKAFAYAWQRYVDFFGGRPPQSDTERRKNTQHRRACQGIWRDEHFQSLRGPGDPPTADALRKKIERHRSQKVGHR